MRINNISSSVQHWPPPILRAPSDAVCRDTRAGHGLGRHTQPRAHVYARASRSGRQEDETHGREHCLAVAWSEREHANAPDRCWHGARNGAERVAGSTCALRRSSALNGAQPEWRPDARRLRYHSIRSCYHSSAFCDQLRTMHVHHKRNEHLYSSACQRPQLNPCGPAACGHQLFECARQLCICG